MRRASVNPFVGVPKAEKDRLVLLGHLTLAELATSRHAVPMGDLLALVGVCRELVAGDRYTAEAHAAVQTADEALSGLQAGTVTHAATVAAIGALLPYFEAMLASVTWRRLQAAQAAARRQATLVPPTPK